jgi:hypothetical protein
VSDITKEILLLVAGAVLGLVFTLLVQPFLAEPAQRFLMRMLGSRAPRGEESIAGKWECRWWKDGEADKATMTVNLRLFLNSVSGSFEFDGRTYHVVGKIDNNTILTGTYYDQYRGRTFHGAFQLHIQPRALTMTGRWIGFNRYNQIMTGPWEWRRNSEQKWPSEMVKDDAPEATPNNSFNPTPR